MAPEMSMQLFQGKGTKVSDLALESPDLNSYMDKIDEFMQRIQ